MRLPYSFAACAILLLSLTSWAQNTDPKAQPEIYKSFIETLELQTKENSMNFSQAMQIVLNATQDEFAGLQWMQQAAEDGQTAALQYVGDIGLTNVPANERMSPSTIKSFAQVKLAATRNFAPAQLNVALCMQNGVGTTEDAAGAAKYLADVAKSGNFILRFKSLQFNKKLNSWFDGELPEVAAELKRGNYFITYQLATLAEDNATRIEWLRRAAKQGSPEASYELSAILSSTAPKQSFALLQEAAKRHQPDAMALLGSCLLEPERLGDIGKKAGIPKNVPAGLHLVKLSSMLHSQLGHYALAQYYLEGRYGLPKDNNRAYKHFEASARLGNLPSIIAMHYMMLSPNTPQSNTKRGLATLEEMADANIPQAAMLLSHAYYKGLGVPKDMRTAEEYLLAAAGMGIPEAYVILAYIITEDAPQDKAKQNRAQNYLRMASADLQDRAQKLYNDLQTLGNWTPQL